jgi:hypothetical protein
MRFGYYADATLVGVADGVIPRKRNIDRITTDKHWTKAL